jgi:hypothetical protein
MRDPWENEFCILQSDNPTSLPSASHQVTRQPLGTNSDDRAGFSVGILTF